MAEFNPQCAEKPLTYGLGAGMFVRGILKHVKVPEDFPVIGGLISAPDYSTGYQPVTSKSETSLFSSLFPPEICAADLCEGELPGCPPPHIVPVEIPRVIFKMSRPFHWSPNTPMALREFIAYGFAVLPEAVDVVARNMKQNLQDTTSTAPPCIGASCTNTNRRLEEGQEGEEFDEIAVEFNDLTYTIDEQLVSALIRNKAFAVLDDGNKRELGQIKFIGFNLESRLPVESESIPEQMSHSVFGMLALLSLTSVALMAGAASLVRGRSRQAKEESSARPVDESPEGYERVSLEA